MDALVGFLVIGALFGFVVWLSKRSVRRHRAQICKGLVAAGATEVGVRDRIAQGTVGGHAVRYVAFIRYKRSPGGTSVWCSVPEIPAQLSFYVRGKSPNLAALPQAIPSGDAGFDAAFEARGHPTEWAQALLADADLSRSLASLLGPSATLSLATSDLAFHSAQPRMKPAEVAALVHEIVALATRLTALAPAK